MVNSIVDFNSFCTSIIALKGDDIAHVRNLDFDFPEYMQKLVYYQRFVNGSQELALAPSIAGFYGVYTALKPGEYSLSYNVRYEHGAKLSRQQAIWLNLHQELNSTVQPFQNFMQRLIIEGHDYDAIVGKLQSQSLNAPCYITIANGKVAEGVIISRGRDSVDHLAVINKASPEAKWYIAQTNMDIWNDKVRDPRYEKAVELLEALG